MASSVSGSDNKASNLLEQYGFKTEVVLAIAAYSLCSGSMMVVNKLAVKAVPAASFVTAVQLAVCILIVVTLAQVKVVEFKGFEMEKVKPYMPYIVSFAGSLYANMRALQAGSVETVIVFRACVPMAVAVLEWMFLGRCLPDVRNTGALGVIGAGTYLYVTSDSAAQTEGLMAYMWVSLYYGFTCFNMTYGKTLCRLTLTENVMYSNVLSLPIIMALACKGDDVAKVAATTWDSYTIFIVLFSCIVGTCISYCGWWCRETVSATMYSVIGVCNKVITIIASQWFFSDHASMTGVIGLAITLGGGIAYRQAPLREPVKVLP